VNRVKDQRGASASAAAQTLTADETFVHEDPDVIAHRVEGYSALLG
jgi:hypothetical protein